jgi:hypothetical protein
MEDALLQAGSREKKIQQYLRKLNCTETIAALMALRLFLPKLPLPAPGTYRLRAASPLPQLPAKTSVKRVELAIPGTS